MKFLCTGITFWIMISACPLAAVQQQSQQNVEAQIRAVLNNQVKSWVENVTVVESIQKQNAQHMSWTKIEVDQANDQWHAELKQPKKPMIEKMMDSDLSRYLQQVQDQSPGLYLSILIIDNKGCTVGQSEVTKDYWHGDKALWQRTFLAGSSTVFVDAMKQEETTQKYGVQASITLIDPTHATPIGVAVVTFDAELLTK